ncbi:hypothetical protein [Aquimarina macrocephali]|uniref:hypothetical protein n=1 Tax=Aquimarina macrocephali TaxID=666563 RepID=UPI003F669AD2
MIIIEAEAQQLQPLPSSASIIIVLTVAENYFNKKWNAVADVVGLPLFIKILALMATECLQTLPNHVYDTIICV